MRSRHVAAHLALALAAVCLVACRSGKRELPRNFIPRPEVSVQSVDQLPEAKQAVIDFSNGDDWILLTSGEWLRGELEYIDHESLYFDSEELDNLKLDYEDVAELRSERVFTILYADGTEAIGRVRLDRERMWLTSTDGTTSVARQAVTRLVPGRPKEANYWSGEVKLGITARSGNTDQTDANGSFGLMRRTAKSRLPIQFDALYSEVNDQETANNQRFYTQYDRYLTERLYITPLGVDALRDTFQNIALRVTPYTSLGYTLVDEGDLELRTNLGLGYRRIEFESVEVGEDSVDEQAAGVIGTGLEWDITADLEMLFDYSAEIGLEDYKNTNQIAVLTLSVDLFSDFDLDVKARWDRIGQPAADENGVTPKKDDFRLTVELGWSF